MKPPALICASHTISGSMPGQVARFGFAERVAAVTGAGFDGLVIHFRDHLHLVEGGTDPAEMRDLVEAAGLDVPAVEFVADWHDAGGTGSFSDALAVARLFGARHVNVGADMAGAGLGPSELVPAFRRICAMAEDAGIGVALELLAWGGISDLEAAVDLAVAGEPNAGLLLDNWHLSFARPLPVEALRDVPLALVAGLQISDAWPMQTEDLSHILSATTHRLLPGAGALDPAAFLVPLWSAAQTCGVTVEVIAPTSEAEAPRDAALAAARAGRATMARAQDSLRDTVKE